jgi:two-component system, chemotaxis family, chemotaxis protein CheY
MPANTSARSPSPTMEEEMQNKPHILVVEDNAALNRVMCFTLERAGFQVTSAANGKIAWDLAQVQTIEMVVTDQQMPEMTGVELSRLMRSSSKYAETPIILLTAKGLELELPVLCQQLGIAASFAKPFSPSTLLSTVQDLLVPVT